MEFPVRCFTCGGVVGHLYDEYKNMLKAKSTPEEALNSLSVERYCCRRMFLSHVETVTDIAKYSRI
jgi:DNA-directed RNA polymerase subunit N (RpoN/RPB10)